MYAIRSYYVLTVIILIVSFIAYSVYLLAKPVPLEIQGQVEATQYRVASKLVGRIDSLPVKKGQEVKVGDLLFTINSPEVEAKLQLV